MVKSHRLPEPRLAAFRPVDSRRGLPVVERLLMLPLPAPAVLRGVFCRRAGALAAGLAYRSSPGFACTAAAARRARHSLAADDLVEITLPLPRGGVLIDQSEFFSIQFFEEFFPRDFLERTGAVARKIDPQNSGIIPLPRVLFTTAGRPPRASAH